MAAEKDRVQCGDRPSNGVSSDYGRHEDERARADVPSKTWLLLKIEWKFMDKLDVLLAEVRRKMDMKSRQEGWTSR
jgi:hypothetical protein